MRVVCIYLFLCYKSLIICYLQDKNSALVQQLHEKDSSSVKLKQSVSKLEHQVDNLNQVCKRSCTILCNGSESVKRTLKYLNPTG